MTHLLWERSRPVLEEQTSKAEGVDSPFDVDEEKRCEEPLT